MRRVWKFQFSLAFLFVLMSTMGNWMTLEVHRANRQRLAVSTIRQAGGVNVFYDYEDGEGSLPACLRRFVGDDLGAKVTRVDVLLLGLRDTDMSTLSALVDVRELWLWDNPISDVGLRRSRKKQNRGETR